MQQILIMQTNGPSVRSKAEGWSADDPNMCKRRPDITTYDKIGLIPGMRDWHCYEAPLFALANGWQLLQPPTKLADREYEWWFVRNVGDS